MPRAELSSSSAAVRFICTRRRFTDGSCFALRVHQQLPRACTSPSIGGRVQLFDDLQHLLYGHGSAREAELAVARNAPLQAFRDVKNAKLNVARQ